MSRNGTRDKLGLLDKLCEYNKYLKIISVEFFFRI